MKRDQNPQYLGVALLRVHLLALDGTGGETHPGKGRLRAGEVVAAQVLGQLLIGLGIGPGQGAHPGGEKVVHHLSSQIQPLELGIDPLGLGGGVGLLGLGRGGRRLLPLFGPGRLLGPFLSDISGNLRQGEVPAGQNLKHQP